MRNKEQSPKKPFQAVILAGGLGTRISEETHTKPKPMVEIGGRPILWHIMKHLAFHGVNDFIVCCGYKGYVIKEYFLNYRMHMSDLEINLSSGDVTPIQSFSEPWKVRLIDTGDVTDTGGRLRRVAQYLNPNQPFIFTYGDGLSDIDISELHQFHQFHQALVTVTAVQPPGRYGFMAIEDNRVYKFKEKPMGDGGWINGGFFIVEPKAIDYVCSDSSSWEGNTLEKICADNQLAPFKHKGFWQSMDTLRDKVKLEEMWSSNCAPWRVWE